MKVLLDSCVWGGARDELRALGHEVVWAGDWDKDPGDAEILAIAFAEERVLVTLDKDSARSPSCVESDMLASCASSPTRRGLRGR